MSKQELYFDYTADLPGKVRMHGTMDRKNWQPEEFLSTTLEAAWAFVRGLLKQDGIWKCTVRIDGHEHRKSIDVMTHPDGAITRLDVIRRSQATSTEAR